MDPIEAWLAGLVHHSVESDLSERSRHERFMVARFIAGAATLAVLPAYLLGRGVPTGLEALAIIALVMPVLSAVLLSRTGRLATAQVLSSLALAAFVAAAGAAFGGSSAAGALLALIIPLEALFCASGRGLMAALAAALSAILAMVLIEHSDGMTPDPSIAMAALLALAVTITASQAAAQGLADRRLKNIVRTALRIGEAREGATLQAIDDLVTWHDRNGNVLRANAAAAKVVAVPATALHGRGLFSHIHVSDRPLFLKAISDAAESAEPVVVRFRIHRGERPDPSDRQTLLTRMGRKGPGRISWVEMRAHRLVSGPGEHAIAAVIRDISTHHQRAEELEASRLEAQETAAAKTRLLATVSHELRTPLNAMIGFSEILIDENSSATKDQRRDYAKIIHDSSHHLLRVVDGLLDLSRLDSGQDDLASEEVDVDELVHSCCDLLEVSAGRAGVAIAREIAPALPGMMADRSACRQILINLLSNAVNFPPRGGRVTVNVKHEGEQVVLTVADTGIGIAAKDLPRVGDPFFRAGEAVDRSQRGNGLGLSVVRRLVTLHRGRLTIASASGDGTSVTVSLPAKPASGRRSGAPVRVKALAPAREMRRALRTG